MNMQKIKWPLIIIILAIISSASVESSEPYEITWSTIDGGGGQSSGPSTMLRAGGPYVLAGTIGQADAGYLGGDNYELLGGFWVGGPLCIVNFEDFANFAIYWLQSGSDSPADLYEDGLINYDDLLEFANVWLCICPYNWPLK
jgi:hypothetical protein